MKISYRNHPILEKLAQGSLGIIPMFEEDKPFFDFYGDDFVRNWKLYHKNFQQEINVISEPFYEASSKADKKLKQLWEDIAVNDTSDFDIKGCYVCGNFIYMIDHELKQGSEDMEIAFYIFDKKGIPLAILIDSSKNKINHIGWISTCFMIKNDQEKIKNWIYSQFGTIVLLKMFKTYAQVETKIIPPNSKVKGIDCKYVNDTKLKLNYLDSKWFTNLVKSDGFNVRGHFRFQPKKKEGEWTKELIWVSEFVKTGYTAPARMLANN
jgi:hypothetical protein